MRLILALAFSLFSAVIPAMASLAVAQDEPALESWSFKCFSDTRTTEDCGIYWATRTDDAEPKSLLGVAIGPQDGKLMLGLLSRESVCLNPLPSIQVDGYAPVSLEAQEYGHRLPDDRFDETLDRMARGTMLFLRFHQPPDCSSQLIPIPLTGFVDAWNQMPN